MFRDEPITPARPEALALAVALRNLNAADEALQQAKRDVPSYTGQWSDADYVADEQETYNRAVDAYADAMKAVCFSDSNPAVANPAMKLLSMKLTDLDLSHVVAHHLRNDGLVYIGDVYTALRDAQPMYDGNSYFWHLMRIPNFGIKKVLKLVEFLHASGLTTAPLPAHDARANSGLYKMLNACLEPEFPLDEWVRPEE